MDHAARTRALQERLEPDEAAILSPGANLRYLTGLDLLNMERHTFLFVPSGGSPVLLVPALEADAVEDGWVDDVRAWDDDEDPLAQAQEIASERRLRGDRIYVDDRMWARHLLDLEDALPVASFRPASSVIADMRMVKGDDELDALRRASRIADTVMGKVRDLGADAVGMTERALARKIRDWFEAEGGEGVSFNPIVAAGGNGAEPHHAPSGKRIEAGEPVVVDIGTKTDGYCSDMTRTLAFDGEPDGVPRDVFDVVREAQQAAIDTVAPGTTAHEIDAAARDIIREAGYGDRFVHRTGHGVGLDVHEPPVIGTGEELQVEAGMVFSIEPGIYIPGEYGVRIEDLVVVTENGCERLNRVPRHWKC